MNNSRIKKILGESPAISIIALVDAIIEDAHTAYSSDIHIDSREKEIKVRMRVDGILQDIYSLPKEIQSEVVTRIKVLAGLRTDEHQTAQDGRFRIVFGESCPVDVRVSIVPTYYGEDTVLRLLSEHSEKFELEKLGFCKEDLEKVGRAARKPHGMILATGPTGSGKTTTLYTILKLLNTKEVSIVTVEDPIEYAIEGIKQIQVNARTGLTFANGLRSILRQDPNIVMVGEIRDSATAGLAVNTALTGHLVLSTLHTNDAATTLPRMLDLGIEPYLITATVNLAIGQRLVRKICEYCKEKHILAPAEQKSLREIKNLSSQFEEIFSVWRGKGCDKCNHSGYRGRMGIYEIIEVDDCMRNAMLQKLSSNEIKKLAMERGMKTMVEDGLEKVKKGITTITEVLRVINE